MPGRNSKKFLSSLFVCLHQEMICCKTPMRLYWCWCVASNRVPSWDDATWLFVYSIRISTKARAQGSREGVAWTSAKYHSLQQMDYFNKTDFFPKKCETYLGDSNVLSSWDHLNVHALFFHHTSAAYQLYFRFTLQWFCIYYYFCYGTHSLSENLFSLSLKWDHFMSNYVTS